MLGKLLKYELRYMIRDFIRIYLFYGALVLFLVFMTFLIKVDNGSGTLFISLYTTLLSVYSVFTVILAFLTITHNIKRFRVNMFSREGYLTNALPVTPEQHIVAKLIAGAVNYIISYIVILVGVFLLFSELGVRLSISILFRDVFDLTKNGKLLPQFLATSTGFVALLLCGYLSSAVRSMIGGSKTKGTLLLVGMIFGYLFISIMISVTFESNGNRYEARSSGLESYIFSIFHTCIAAVEFYFITHIIKNRLNLQ